MGRKGSGQAVCKGLKEEGEGRRHPSCLVPGIEIWRPRRSRAGQGSPGSWLGAGWLAGAGILLQSQGRPRSEAGRTEDPAGNFLWRKSQSHADRHHHQLVSNLAWPLLSVLSRPVVSLVPQKAAQTASSLSNLPPAPSCFTDEVTFHFIEHGGPQKGVSSPSHC